MGGAAGGGKSIALLLEPLYHVNVPGFNAVLFRRVLPEIKRPGGLLDESLKFYPRAKGELNLTELTWKFPKGSKVTFAGLEHEKDLLAWHGSQITLCSFDELTSFSAKQFFYLLSRNRSTCGVRPYVRATCNPDADSWVAKFLAWWIDQETGYVIPERAGKIRWFVRDGERIVWADSPDRFKKDYPDVVPKSVSFFPAKLSDNPALMKADPGYKANLMALPLVDRERLLGGNWKIKPAAGKVFNRAWFGTPVSAAPPGGVECRYFDFAASEKKLKGDDPDYTAGVKLRRTPDGRLWVTDCLMLRAGPVEVEQQLFAAVRLDAEQAKRDGCLYRVAWEQEPGSASVRESHRLVRSLMGYDCKAENLHGLGDKVQRAKGLASQCEGGAVRLVAGPWNEDFLAVLHQFPDGTHDDAVDAASGAFRQLCQMAGGPLKVISSGGAPLVNPALQAQARLLGARMPQGQLVKGPPPRR